MYLTGIERKPGVRLDEFPWNLPTFRWLERLEFNSPVTFLVGENGPGKPPPLEGLAAGMQAAAAGRAEIDADDSAAVRQRLPLLAPPPCRPAPVRARRGSVRL